MDVLDNWFQSIRGGNLKEAITIFKNKPDVINTFTTINDGRNHYQTNAIIEASFQGNRDLVKWLIENNADVNSVSDGGWRPIHFAAQHGHVTTVNLLVLGGAEVNVKTETNETPILLALQAYMRDTVKKLMYHGASLVGIDRNFLHMWIQKDVLDPSCLDDENKAYLADSNYPKSDMNGYDVMIRQTEREIEEIKIVKLTKGKLVTDYDNDLRRRRQELVKKMRRVNEQQGALTTLIRKVALSDIDNERIEYCKEAVVSMNSPDSVMPQTKTLDHLINLLELCICDSDSSEIFIRLASKLMMDILQHNSRRGELAVVDFWCRIFDKMSNLQIEQYTMKILEMLTYMIEGASDTVVNNFKNIKESFLKTWEIFFENLGFPRCLSTSLRILTLVQALVPDSVHHRFHNVIDIMIGWCIHPDTDMVTLESIRERSADLHECWISDIVNLKKTISNLQKDVTSHCQILARIHRLDKDRVQVDELRTKIRYFCFALSCVTAGISGQADVTDLGALIRRRKIEQPLSSVMISGIVEKLCEAIAFCSKQLDFDNLLLQSDTVLLHLLSCLDEHEALPGTYSAVFRYVFSTTSPLQSRTSTVATGITTTTDSTGNMDHNTRQLLGSHLDLIHLCCLRMTIDPAIVIQVFSPANWVHGCLFYGSTIHKDILRRLLRTADLVIERPALVATFYQIVLSDLELSMNSLLKLSGSIKQVHLVQSNAFKTRIYDCDQAQLVIRYNITMLLMLRDRVVKDPSLVLVPSIQVLFQRYLSVLEPRMAEQYPALTLFIIETVNKVTRTPDSVHDLILYNCHYLAVTNLDGNIKERIFTLLRMALDDYQFNSEDKDDSTINVVFRTVTEYVTTVTYGNDKDDIVMTCLTLVTTVIRTHHVSLHKSTKTMLRDSMVRFTNHSRHDIRLAAFSLYYTLIDPDTSTTTTESLAHDIRSIQSISLRGRSFKFPLDFSKSIFHWIMHGSDDSTLGSNETMRLYDLVVTQDSSKARPFKNRMVILYEILINACWDCVRQKLRFDQSTDSRITLMTIENMVKCILTNGNFIKTVNDKRFRKLMFKFISKSATDQLMSINILLLLLDVLEKMFYNCYEGCSVGMPPVNKTSENFFVTNKHVCSDWFIKMRLMIVALAQYAGQWGTVVWHGMQLLQHHLAKDDSLSDAATRVLVPEMEDCIVFTAMALSKLGNWESLLGLGRMTVRLYGTKFDWIEALADKTIGHLETALCKFEDYIRAHHDPDRAKQTPELRLLTRKPAGHSSFILCTEEIADCNRLLANVEGLEKWANQISAWKTDSTMLEAQKSSINWGRLTCLAKLSQWDNSTDENTISALQKNQPEISWKYRSMTDHCEDALFIGAVSKSTEDLSRVEHLVAQLASVQSLCDHPAALLSPELVLISERSKCLRQGHQQSGQGPIVVDTKTLATFSATLPLSVINFCTVIQKSYNLDPCFSNHKYSIKWHRNLRNFTKSATVIDQCAKNFLDKELSRLGPLNDSKNPIVQMELERQSVKLLWATDKRSDALASLTSSLREGLLFETSDPGIHGAKCRINTKSLLTLFQWLSTDKSVFALCTDQALSSSLQFLTELAEVPWINGLPLVSPQQRSSDKPCLSSATDVCSQLLILASKSKDNNQDINNNDKSFMTLAQWCLSRSRSLDDAGLSGHQLTSIKDGLSKMGLAREEVDQVSHLFVDRFQPSKMHSEEDWLGACYDDDSYLDGLRASVRSLCPSLDDVTIQGVQALWTDVVISRHFSLHIAASDAYFSFLKDARPQAPTTAIDNLGTKNRTTANLRILSLLGKRSRQLRDSIIGKLRASAPVSWINVIPQLFARIKHPDSGIRASVTELLQRFALSDSGRSRLIIYPTIVGTMNEDNTVTVALNADNTQGQAPPLPGSCHDIMKVLKDNNESLVHEVQIFIRELRRITVLWDELWIASLTQCYDELNKKTNQLQTEIDRISKDNDSLSDNMQIILQLKYNSIIQPALFILERVKAATSVSPETPREQWFHDTFNEEINSTINAIKSPTNIVEFKDCWKKVKELQELMITESNDNSKMRVKRGRHQFLSLKLSEISPGLAKISNSRIPIPGMEDVELVSMDSHISILPTKTKPKKLQFVASNGQRYNYLYKGLEDLRLDERIMQILGVANTMFSKLNETESNKYHITTYSVTPLGPRAGLIQMVEDATSLFTLYKRHQVRTKANSDLSKTRFKSGAFIDNTTITTTVISDEGNPILRPTDIFWQKLRPKLEAAKLDVGLDNRDKWPSSILIEVLNELKRETPSDLLSKELWCCSINSQHWFRSSIGFTRSCAVMSMMGYILGLGDRHLDNLLVNLSSGQMIHIDYNVCFDKGSALKVPEKVPFRLTDIITDVFGPPGCDGLFKVSCEKVLDVAQQAEDSVLTLMDTFVLDPIVDWSSGIESGHYGSFEGGKFAVVNCLRTVIEKRCVEFMIGLNNFQAVLIRIDSVAVDENKDTMTRVLDGLLSRLDDNLEMCQRIQDKDREIRSKTEMVTYLDRYKDDNTKCDLLDKVNHVKSIQTRSTTITVDLERRLAQMTEATADHGIFFNMILSNSDFITFKLDLKNLVSFYEDSIVNIEKCTARYLDCVDDTEDDHVTRTGCESIVADLRSLVPDVKALQDCVPMFEKYRLLMLEMPESYFSSDRCSHMTTIIKDLIDDGHSRSPEMFLGKMEDYRSRWLSAVTEDQVTKLSVERDHWQRLLRLHSDHVTEIQTKIVNPSHEDEIQQLEHIWQLTMYENVGINVFKAVLLEQYLEMASTASHIDLSMIAKVPEQVSLSIDYNDTLRKYLQLMNAHDNYLKILSNSMQIFGLYMTQPEFTVVSSMMSSLHKVSLSLASFETNFIEIIMPESIKIMKNLSSDDEDLVNELQSIVKDTDNVLLHFNIALTSASYDINNYDNIHTKIVVPIKDRMSRLMDTINVKIDTSRQLRLLIASFYTTIHHSYQQVCDFIDCCVNSSTPSSWNYVDLVATSALHISPMWTKSHKLLKDAVYMTSLRALITTLDHCRLMATSLLSDTSATDDLDNILLNMLRPVELYFNFVNRHILAGVASQCFGKMFCLLLEFTGWNLDTMIAETVPSCAISAEYICNSVSSFRKTEYPNAVNFYGQLQFRFNNYKTLTGFAVEPHMSLRFLSRNISFHKTICSLARNQLLSLSWMRKDVLGVDQDAKEDLALVTEMDGLLQDMASKMDLGRTLMTKFESLVRDFGDLDRGMGASASATASDGCQKMARDRAVSLASIRKRLHTVNGAMVNIDRFECLRARSEQGSRFDDEILQFLDETRRLLDEVSQCSGLVAPIEAEIVRCKLDHNVDDNDGGDGDSGSTWWQTLAEILATEIVDGTDGQRHQVAMLDDVMGLYDEELRHLASVLASTYQPMISQLKPTLRSLCSIARKLKAYLSGTTHCSVQNIASIKGRLTAVCALMSLMESFNARIDGLTMVTDRGSGNGLVTTRERLTKDRANVASLRTAVVPQLFTVLKSLSPLTTSDDNDNDDGDGDGDLMSFMDGTDGFTNNNMAETNGRPSSTSPGPMQVAMDGADDTGLASIKEAQMYTGDLKKYVGNSSGVQRAMDVWRMVESRVRRPSSSVSSDGSVTQVQGGDQEARRIQSLGQYVDKCIRAARHPDNLARMYEGWTAWV